MGEGSGDEYDGEGEIGLTVEEGGVVSEEGTLGRGGAVEGWEVWRERCVVREEEGLHELEEGGRGVEGWKRTEEIERSEGLGEEIGFVAWGWRGSEVHCVVEGGGGEQEGDGEGEGLHGGEKGGENGLKRKGVLEEGRRREEEDQVVVHFDTGWGNRGRRRWEEAVLCHGWMRGCDRTMVGRERHGLGRRKEGKGERDDRLVLNS